MKSVSLGDDAIRVMRANQSAAPRIGDVQHQRQRVATGGARGVVDLGAGASGEGHREAVGGQAQRDAAATAGDECDTWGHAVILTKQPIVVGMAANPEPDEPVCRFDCESAVVSSDPSRPEPAALLEVKCGVPRVLLQARVRLIGESRAAGIGITPRNREMRDESERRGLASRVIAKGLGGKIVEAARGSITLDLAIPGRPVVLQKPGAKLRELVRRERLDVLLDLLDLAHNPSTGDLQSSIRRAEDRSRCPAD